MAETGARSRLAGAGAVIDPQVMGPALPGTEAGPDDFEELLRRGIERAQEFSGDV